MKILNITIVLLLILLPAAFAQQDIDSKHHKRIAQLGLSKQINWKHSYVGDKPKANGIKTSETHFDNKGNITTVVSFYENGNIKSREVYEYNLDGEKISYTKYVGDQIKYQKKTVYNRDKIAEEKGYNGSENFSNIFEYNAAGKVSKITYYGGNDNLQETRYFTYDGNTTYVEVKNPAGAVIQKIAITKDSDGNIIEEKSYSATNTVINKTTYKYNTDELPVEESKFGTGNSLRYKYIYNYSSEGWLLEYIEENPHDGKFTKKKYSYDDQGNLLKLEWRRKPDEDFNSMTYSYDNRGLRTQVETYMPSVKFKLLNKFTYE